MASRTEVDRRRRIGGTRSGIVLVTFPAASTIFTDPDEYDLSSSRYRHFLPQVLHRDRRLAARLPVRSPASA